MTKLSENTKQNILALSISGIVIFLFSFIFNHAKMIGSTCLQIIDALNPFLFGFGITFLIQPLCKIVEERWLIRSDIKQKSKRRIAVAVSMVVLILVIASFFIVLIPQLSDSITLLFSNMDSYLKTVSDFVTKIYQDSEYASIADSIYTQLQSMVTNFVSGTAGLVTKLVSYTYQLVSGILDFLIGMIIAVYLLLDREKFVRQVKRVNYSVFPKRIADWLVELTRLSSKMFYNFIFGKALDSFIMGVLCFICTSIMKIPYATLISFIVGITNMIPFFGPFIGAIPSIFILLIIKPMAALEFAVFVLILQQIDGNIIGPYILGDSMGLPPIWIMFAILVGGSLFGVVGMFLGVPIFSIVYILLTKRVDHNLEEKNIKIE